MDDYRKYQFSKREYFFAIMEGTLLNALLAWLFYDSFLAMLPGSVVMILYFQEKRRKLSRKRKKRMREDLKEFLNGLIAALQTGRSMENAFAEGLKDMANCREEREFSYEMKQICAKVAVGEPLERLLEDFARRAHMEELQYFSEVFSVAKRSGGNIVGIMRNTIRMLQERLEAQEEMVTVLAEKQMEFTIMSVIPMAMIVYLRIGAANLIGSLYGNVQGILIMSVCLLIYGGCYLYGKRLLEMED